MRPDRPGAEDSGVQTSRQEGTRVCYLPVNTIRL